MSNQTYMNNRMDGKVTMFPPTLEGTTITPEDTSIPSNAVEDYSGSVDGGGFKAVMVNPKSAVHLIDPDFIMGVGEVMRFGATKYAKHNWMRGMAWTEPYGAALRHLFKWALGEKLDPETGISHLHHAACNLMFLGYYEREAKKYDKLDDRVFKYGEENE